MTIEKEVKMGVKDEMDHTSSKKVAKKIAKDHLKKDPKYYTKLKKAGLEEGAIDAIKKYIKRGMKTPKQFAKKKADNELDRARSIGDIYAGSRRSRDTEEFNVDKADYDKAIRRADKYREFSKKKRMNEATLGEGIKEKIKGMIRREKQKDMPIIQNRRDYAHGKAADAYAKGNTKKGDRYMKWRKKSLDSVNEATLGGAKLAGKENPNNVKSKKSGFTINTKMNDAYSKVPDAKGLVRKRLLQKGKAAWNVGHAKKLAEGLKQGDYGHEKEKSKNIKKVFKPKKQDKKKDSSWNNSVDRQSGAFDDGEIARHYERMWENKENLQEAPSKNPAAQKAKSYANAHYRKANNAFDRGDDREMENQDNKYQTAQKAYKKALKKKQNLQELTKKTLKSYLRKSNKDAATKAMWTSRFGDGNDERKLDNRKKGIKRAKDRVSGTAMVKKKYNMKEENLHEISKKLLANYMEKSKKQTNDITKKYNKGTNTPKDDKTFDKRVDGQITASNKFHGRAKVSPSGKDKAYDAARKILKKKTPERFNEENLQELSKDTLKSYVSKAVKSRDDNDKKAKEHAWRANDAGTIKTLSKHIGKRDQAEKKVANRDKGIKTAKDKIWRKNAQDDYDGPNRDGKKASDGVRHTGD